MGVVPGQRELSAGQDFALQDGSTLHVQLVRTAMNPELRVLRDGQPLPGTASDPETRLRNAFGIVFLIAGLNLVLGILAVLFRLPFLEELGMGVPSVVLGLIYLVLGFFARRRSAVALIIAILLFAVDGVLGVVFAVSAGASPSIGGILVRAFLLIPMVQGVGAMRAADKG